MRLNALCSSCLIVIGMCTGCARRAVEAPASLPVPERASATTPAINDAETGGNVSPQAVEGLAPAFFAFDSYALDETAREAMDRSGAHLVER